nr:hypothetical protein [Tanacetum cinerariifolium]
KTLLMLEILSRRFFLKLNLSDHRNNQKRSGDFIREEMEKMREEIRNVASTSTAGQNKARQQSDNQTGLNNMLHSRVTKIEFPRFEGEDVRGWLFKCEQFFKVDGVADDQKIKQVKSVKDYIDEYDKLLCRVELSEEQSISFFLAGLQNDVKVAVRMFKPRSLAELYGLTKLQDANLNAMEINNKMPLFPNSRFNGYNSTYPNSPKHVSFPTLNSNWRNRIASPNTAPIRKQLTQRNLKRKGLRIFVFIVIKKYTLGHKCLSQMFSLKVVVDNDEEDIVREAAKEDAKRRC